MDVIFLNFPPFAFIITRMAHFKKIIQQRNTYLCRNDPLLPLGGVLVALLAHTRNLVGKHFI